MWSNNKHHGMPWHFLFGKSGWTNSNIEEALLLFQKGVVPFLAKQSSHLENWTLASKSTKPALTELAMISCPIWPNLVCQVIEWEIESSLWESTVDRKMPWGQPSCWSSYAVWWLFKKPLVILDFSSFEAILNTFCNLD